MLGCLVRYMDITEGSRAMLGYPVCYTRVIKGSWAMLGCPVGYMDVMKRSRIMLGYPVCYMGVMEGSWAMPGCRWGTWTSRRGPDSRAMLGCPVR
jgi:hypothetical protein